MGSRTWPLRQLTSTTCLPKGLRRSLTYSSCPRWLCFGMVIGGFFNVELPEGGLSDTWQVLTVKLQKTMQLSSVTDYVSREDGLVLRSVPT